MTDATNRRPTITDIAREAGVSKATVSRSLSGEPGVSRATRDAIVALARERGWRPNSAARALSRGQAGTLGWAVRQTAKVTTVDPYFMDLFVGIQLALKSTPFDLLVKLVANEREEIAQHEDWTTERRVDGIFLTDVESVDRRLERLLDGQVVVGAIVDDPQAFLTPRFPPERMAWIDPCNSAGVTLTMTHLVELGRRQIVWVLGPAELASTEAKRLSLERWARAHDGYEVLLVHSTFNSTDSSVTALKEVVAGGATAVVVDNERAAMETIRRLEAVGVSVPTDVAVVAWLGGAAVDDPPVTALAHEVIDLGSRWASAMIRTAYPSYSSPSLSTARTAALPSLVVGASTAAGGV